MMAFETIIWYKIILTYLNLKIIGIHKNNENFCLNNIEKIKLKIKHNYLSEQFSD